MTQPRLRVVYDESKVLDGLIGDNGLRVFYCQQWEEPTLPVYQIPARSYEQACRIARRYFEITGTVAIWNEATWESRKTQTPVEPQLYGGSGEFFSARTRGDEAGHRVLRKQSLSEIEGDGGGDRA